MGFCLTWLASTLLPIQFVLKLDVLFTNLFNMCGEIFQVVNSAMSLIK